jgi:hypothetical protein
MYSTGGRPGASHDLLETKKCPATKDRAKGRSMGNVSAPRRRRNQNFDFPAKRRREIVLHARYVGAADTEDFPRWLIAWVWHNPRAKGQVWSVMECAKNMGGKITEAEASAITEEASITRKHLSADNLARFLGVTYEQRQALHITTIGSVNVKKRARKELRGRQNRMAHERGRRVLGMRPQSESLSATQPWRKEGMSRRTWERHRNKARDANDATLSAAIFLSSEDRLASPEGKNGCPSGAVAPKQGRGYPPSQAATTMAADGYETLPLELRMMALGLPIPQNLAPAFGVAA